MVKLRDFLIAHGLDLTGWTLHGATISADGLVLAGNGINPQGFSEAWVARIPEPGTWVMAVVGMAGVVLTSVRRTLRRLTCTYAK